MSHAFKKVPKREPKPFSFVAAVTKHSDMWWLNAPTASRDHGSWDEHERALMWLMERGMKPRVSMDDLWEERNG